MPNDATRATAESLPERFDAGILEIELTNLCHVLNVAFDHVVDSGVDGDLFASAVSMTYVARDLAKQLSRKVQSQIDVLDAAFEGRRGSRSLRD